MVVRILALTPPSKCCPEKQNAADCLRMSGCRMEAQDRLWRFADTACKRVALLTEYL